MQVIVKKSEDKKTLPCDSAALIKVYGKTISETDRKNILRIEMKDREGADFLSNPIVMIYDKEKLLFTGDVYQFINLLEKNLNEKD